MQLGGQARRLGGSWRRSRGILGRHRISYDVGLLRLHLARTHRLG